MEQENKIKFANDILKYCGKYYIPPEALLSILEDQKVLPMLRGKAMEYRVYLQLLHVLPSNVWSVQKLNLNAQPGTYDEDISVTHRKTGMILKVESKSAARGSFKIGTPRMIIKEPHFRVKCHRSRSNMELADSSNDRYSVDCFDILVTNPANAIYQGNTVSENLEVVNSAGMKTILYDHYGVGTDAELIEACENDWRFCVPTDIGEEGYIPRTPGVCLVDDIHWKNLNDVEKTLLFIIENKWKQKLPTRRNP